eukprot:gene31394-38776_t
MDLDVRLPPIPAHIFPDDKLDRSLVSLSDFTNRGCSVILTDTSLYITHNGETLLMGSKLPRAKLWEFNFSKPPIAALLPAHEQTVSDESDGFHSVDLGVPDSVAYNIVTHQHNAEFVKYTHACFGSPPNSTFIKSARRGYMQTLPRLTGKVIAANPPSSTASAKGHLDLNRQGQRSTQPKPVSTNVGLSVDDVIKLLDLDEHEQELLRAGTSNDLFVKEINLSDTYYTDGAAHLPVNSRHGNYYIIIAVFNNYIHVEPVPDRSAPSLLKAHKAILEFFLQRGHRPRVHRMDNETSTALKTYMSTQGLVVEHVPPHNHRANRAERAIRDFKNHLISMFCTCNPSFPVSLWEDMLPQAEITINTLRPFGPTPEMSAYEGMHGKQFDFNRHPIAPCGTAVIIHETPATRPSWGPHGKHGFYLGPALEHYRCYNIFVTATGRTRVSDSIAWFPASFHMPGSSAKELLEKAITALKDTFTSIADSDRVRSDDRQRFLDMSGSIADALHGAAKLLLPAQLDEQPFAEHPLPVALTTFTPLTHEERTTSLPPPPTQLSGNPSAQPSVDPSAQPSVLPSASTPPPARLSVSPSSSPRDIPSSVTSSQPSQQDVPSSSLPPAQLSVNNDVPHTPATSSTLPPPMQLRILQPLTQGARKSPPRSASQRRRARRHSSKMFLLRDLVRLQGVPPAERTTTGRIRRMPERFALSAVVQDDYLRAALAAATTTNDVSLAVDIAAICAPLTYRQTQTGPDKDLWRVAESEEFIRLVELSKTMRFIRWADIPEGREASYYHPQPSIKVKEGVHKRRIRGTYGGNKSDYTGPVAAQTADLATVKLFLNSVVSTPGAKLATADVTDFYLSTDLERFEYMRITRAQLPDDIVARYDLEGLFNKGHNHAADYVMVEIVKGIYGLPQAGLLAQEKLVAHLATHGYHKAANTACLFTHETRQVSFTLVVDDFAIKYVKDADLEHLLASLREVYVMTVDYTGSKYIGIDIHHNREARTISLSMPNYVRKALERFNIKPAKHVTDSPLLYTPPNYGKAKQQYATSDESAPLSPDRVKLLQQIIGVFLYYARAVDSTMLMALSRFASQQSHATEQLFSDVQRFLQYACTWPVAILVYKASEMRLMVQSDASYLSEPNARSRAGGLFYMGNSSDTMQSSVNGAVECVSTIIKSVVSSAFEAEYAALFICGQTAQSMRSTLLDLGHPQGATPIICDNECAVGVANQTVKQRRRSKAIDMRYHWVRDRIRSGLINVYWRKGADNLADFFTKALPVHRHQELMALLVHSPPQPHNASLNQRAKRSHAYRARRIAMHTA